MRQPIIKKIKLQKHFSFLYFVFLIVINWIRNAFITMQKYNGCLQEKLNFKISIEQNES